MRGKSFKTLIVMALILSMCLSLVACGNKKEEAKEDLKEEIEEVEEEAKEEVKEDVKLEGVNLAGLKGPTTIGFVNLLEDFEKDNKFTMHTMADEVAKGLTKGEIDIAAIPANLAATLYNKTEGKVKVAAINTLGVLYIVENGDSIEKPEDLNGKTIYTIGKGTTPEGVLTNFIEKHGLKDVNVEYKSEASEIGALLSTEEDVIAMIPEPFVSVMETKNEKLRIVFNMNDQWKDLNDGNLQVTGVLAVREDFLKEKPEELNKFLEMYKESIEEVQSDLEETAKLVEEREIIPAGMGEKAIPRTNISYIDGADMEKYLSNYLETLFNFNDKLVGGKLPDGDFYYKK